MKCTTPVIIKAFVSAGMILILGSCTSRTEDNNEIPIIVNCENAICKATLYDIEVSMHNMRLKNAEGIDSEDQVVMYCLKTNYGCGFLVYHSLEKLYNTDSNKFSFLEDKYFVGDKEKFLEAIAGETVQQTIKNIAIIEDDIKKSCDCS